MLIDIAQLEFIDLKLRKVINYIGETGLKFTITSLYRIDDGGVHGALPLRGIDLRMRNKNIGDAIVKEINDEWQYDPKRPSFKCAILHGVGKNLHIHLQVHHNTVRKS